LLTTSELSKQGDCTVQSVEDIPAAEFDEILDLKIDTDAIVLARLALI
jgi:hypothetical protein